MNQALLIIDMQNDYFPGGKMELVGAEAAAENARRLLDAFRAAGRPVIHIQHIAVQPGATFFLPESEGAQIHSQLAPQSAEKVFVKHYPSSFRETGLDDYLKEQGIDSLLVVGAMSHMCVDTTTRAAFDLGYACLLAHDACATRDLEFGNRIVSAADVHASYMAALGMVFAEVKSTEELLAGWD